MSVDKKGPDGVFKDLTSRYAEEYGFRLKQELKALEKENIEYAAPRLDARIRELTGRKKWGARGLAAAVLALCILVPALMRSGFLDMTGSPASSSAAPSYALSSAPPASSSAAPSGAGSAPGSMHYEIIPLGFELPERFSVSDTELDNGKSVYYLDDGLLDPIVMTLERAGTVYSGGLTELYYGSTPLYAAATGDYNLLTFNAGDITYELTCRYELETLYELGINILENF